MFRIAILGRPNVGKSSLFNRICKKSIAIVNEEEGTTRDRLISIAKFNSIDFEIVDTGGIDKNSKDLFQTRIKEQAITAAQEADVIFLVIDIRCGITKEDEILGKTLLALQKPIILVANKADSSKANSLINDLYGLGIPTIIPTSTAHNTNIDWLLSEAFKLLPSSMLENSENTSCNSDNIIKIALVGSPNVGKSTFINTLLKSNRCLIDSQAGTTRDNVDVTYFHNEQPFIFIDTAGLKKQKSLKTSVEWISSSRSETAIKRAHTCLLLIEATKGFTNFDQKILSIIEKNQKPTILLVNKWDLLKEVRMEHYIKDLKALHKFLYDVPILCISTLNNRNIEKIFPIINKIQEAGKRKIPTHAFNKLIISAMQQHHPSMINGKRLRIYYGTQKSIQPPCFLLFVNNKSLLEKTYEQYLKNKIKSNFNFKGLPILLEIKEKKRNNK